MTLGQFFDYISANPIWVLIYFTAIPAISFLVGISTRGNGHKNPWAFLFTGLLYMVCTPAIFAITLSFYIFFFERKSILDMNMITQVLPVISMLVTIYIIKKFVNLQAIPGFNKLGNLFTILAMIIILLWILEKTHIWVVSFVPFHYFIILLIGLIVMLRLAWVRLSK
jgi:hypothetical protein